MKPTLTLLFTISTFFVFSQVTIFKHSTEELEPLGYSETSKHFIQVNNKTAVYDIETDKVITELNGIYSNEKIVLDKYLILSPKFNFEDKSMTVLNIENGYHNQTEMLETTEGISRLYALDKELNKYYLDENDKWRKTDYYPNKKYNLKGWNITSKKLKYKDYEVDERTKTIFLNSMSFSFFNRCAPYLVFAADTKTLIDVNGKATRVDPEIIKENLDCFNEFSRIDYFGYLFDEELFEEEYSAKSQFRFKDRIYFQTQQDRWRYKDSKGEYHDLKCSEILSRNKKYLFGRYDGMLYYISEKDHSPIVKVGNKNPRLIDKRILHVYDDNRFYDLERQEFISPEGCEDSYGIKNGIAYKQGGIWTVKLIGTNKKLQLKGHKVYRIAKGVIAMKNNDQTHYYDWNGDMICSGNRNHMRIFGDSFIQCVSMSGKKLLKKMDGTNLSFSNYHHASMLMNKIALINYKEVSVFDENMELMYTLNNYKDHNKEGIYTYGAEEVEFQDFEGNKKKITLDVFEELKRPYQTKNVEESKALMLDNIQMLDSFLTIHPTETEVLLERIKLGSLYLGSSLDPEFENFVKRLNRDNPGFIDLAILKNIVEGIAHPELREGAIIKSKQILDNPDRGSDQHFFAKQSEDYYAFFNYYLGYLYHLENDTAQSNQYKKMAMDFYKEMGFEELFKLY
ncbi:MAG: hypothetical protein AAGA77_04140 [Bacteroidota bacterium]